MMDPVALPRDRDNGTSTGSGGGGSRGAVEGLLVHDCLRQEYGEHLRGNGFIGCWLKAAKISAC